MLLLSKSVIRNMVQRRLCGKSHVTGDSSPREGRETQAGVFQKSHTRCLFQAAVMHNSIHGQLSLHGRIEGGCKQKVSMQRCEHESGMKNTHLIK